ncbi:MAG: hypothetical protein WCO30_00800 [bacterium]
MKTLRESCFALSTKLLRNDLKKARNKEPIEGFLNFIYNGKPSALDYKIEYYPDDNAYLIISYAAEPQQILLSERELTYGTRTYLTCGCSHKTNTLYLKNTQGSFFFACFNCHRLRYKSTTINCRSDHGRVLYQQLKRLELIDMKENIGRIFYRSKFTKKFVAWLKLCEKTGLFKEVVSAQKTMELIKEYQSQ